jgi:hypothetical protein
MDCGFDPAPSPINIADRWIIDIGADFDPAPSSINIAGTNLTDR